MYGAYIECVRRDTVCLIVILSVTETQNQNDSDKDGLPAHCMLFLTTETLRFFILVEGHTLLPHGHLTRHIARRNTHPVDGLVRQLLVSRTPHTHRSLSQAQESQNPAEKHVEEGAAEFDPLASK